jgi:hypothetical protein
VPSIQTARKARADARDGSDGRRELRRLVGEGAGGALDRRQGRGDQARNSELDRSGVKRHGQNAGKMMVNGAAFIAHAAAAAPIVIMMRYGCTRATAIKNRAGVRDRVDCV